MHFFREQTVHAIMGSLMCLLYDAADNLAQVIVDFDLENGSFSFVDREDLLTTFSPK